MAEFVNNVIYVTTTLLGINITVYVLSVTFLGDALELAMNEKIRAEMADKANIDKQINELKEDQKSSDYNDEELKGFGKKINTLIATRTSSKKRQEEIKRKYNHLSFLNCVGLPGSAFVVIILLYLLVFNSLNEVSRAGVVVISFVLLFYGVFKIVKALILVERVARGSDNRRWGKMSETFLKSLTEHHKARMKIEEKQKPRPGLHCSELSPIKIKKGSKKEIEFILILDDDYGNYLDIADVYIFTSPQIELSTEDGNAGVSKQNKNFKHLPAANSLKFREKNLFPGINYPITISISGEEVGVFEMKTMIACSGISKHVKDSETIKIIVEEEKKEK